LVGRNRRLVAHNFVPVTRNIASVTHNFASVTHSLALVTRSLTLVTRNFAPVLSNLVQNLAGKCLNYKLLAAGLVPRSQHRQDTIPDTTHRPNSLAASPGKVYMTTVAQPLGLTFTGENLNEKQRALVNLGADDFGRRIASVHANGIIKFTFDSAGSNAQFGRRSDSGSVFCHDFQCRSD